jgi:hypothetical protein
MPRARPDIKILEKVMLESQTIERFELQRNVSLGGAAVTSAILVALTQVALKLTTIAASVSLPFWVALGLLYELYIHLGPRSYAHYSTKFPQALAKFLAWPSLIGLLVAMGGVVWFLLPSAIIGFVLAIIVAILAYGIFMYELSDWWRTNVETPEQSK